MFYQIFPGIEHTAIMDMDQIMCSISLIMVIKNNVITKRMQYHIKITFLSVCYFCVCHC